MVKKPVNTAKYRIRWMRALRMLVEITLIWLGLNFVVSNYGDVLVTATQLLYWDFLAIVYLTVGAFTLRRHRSAVGEAADRSPLERVWISEHRFVYLFTLAASLTGMSAPFFVSYTAGSGQPYVELYSKVTGATAMLAGWLLLHVGYASFYRAIYYRVDDGAFQGLRFPDTKVPNTVDFVYFALTVGTTFATSDVDVIRPSMRWHVMVHSVVSFFYNTIVLAFAIKMITG